MRNLKRALSLTLASVMLLGMMVVGSSAAAGYDDVDVNDNVEAIEVLQAVQVMVGDDRGFGPDRPVTRNEMAVVMGKLLNLDYNYYSASCPFTDVADWAKGWVGAAAANGIVSGRGNGIYDGEATVTAVEAASMMMRALGYFKYQNDYADGFQVATVRQGTKIGIFDQVGTDATTAMTRNQVAQMALNALQSGMVEPDGNTINLTTPDGSVFTGKVNYVYRTSAKDFAGAIGKVGATSAGSTNTGLIVELGEQLYNGNLKLYDDRTDDFGRPSRKWEYDGKAIGTYMKKELIDQEWTDKVTGKMFYDLLGSDTIKNYDFQITIDGVNVDEEKAVMNSDTKAASYFDATYMTKTWKEGVGQTGKGVLTQVFVDPDYGKYGKVWISVINTYLAKATGDYNDKKDEIKLDVYALANDDDIYYKFHDKDKGFAVKVVDDQSKNLTAAGEDFSKVIDMKKDDIVLVTVANGEIKSVADPQVLSAVELSEFSKYNYVINDGTKYEYNTTIDYDPEVLEDYTDEKGSGTQQLKDTEYNLFLDPYGYLIGVEVVEAVKNYIFLTGIDQGNSNLNAKTADAAGILTDGTFVNFRMNMKDSRTKTFAEGAHKNKTINPAGWGDETNDANPPATTSGNKFQGHALWNTWCTYTVDKDGTYTLTEVGDFDATQADSKPAKAGQYADLTYADEKIDTKHVALKGKDSGAFVYGNDDSVYILAEVKEVNAKNKIYKGFPIADGAKVTTTVAVDKPVVVISGVDSMGTGIDNVKIETLVDKDDILDAASTPKSAATAYPGYVYTLFDRDGYVIAAVILGEDSGTSKNLVYSHKDDVESERYNKADDNWTWTRKVIRDGEEVLLTQTGSKVDPEKSIYEMTENTWYEVTYKADGTVKEAKHAYYDEEGMREGYEATPKADGGVLTLTTDPDDKAQAGDFVDDIENLVNAINEKTTVLYEQVWGEGKDADDADVNSGKNLAEDNAPSLKGSTLYVNTDAKKGFYVSKDVKSVLIQKNGGEKTTTYGSGTSELESILKSLNYKGPEDTGSYLFKISAILVNGRATVVVIHDWNEGAKDYGTVNDKDDEEEETGEVEIYVNFYLDVDAKTGKQGAEFIVKKAASKTGRLTLEQADINAKLTELGLKVDTAKNPLPMSLEVKGTGDGYAEANIQVKAGTRNIKLPEGYKIEYAADPNGLWTEETGNTYDATKAADGVEVPTGATVTVTVPASVNTWYVVDPTVAAVSRTNDAHFKTAAGTFTIAAGTAKLDYKTKLADKYYKVSAAAKANIGTLDTNITLASEEIAASYKMIGESITVKVNGTGKGAAGGATGTISAADVSGMTFTATTNTVTGPADTTTDYTSQQFSFELGGTPTNKTIAVEFAVA